MGLTGLEEAVANASNGGSFRNPKCKSSFRKNDCEVDMEGKSKDDPHEPSNDVEERAGDDT